VTQLTKKNRKKNACVWVLKNASELKKKKKLCKGKTKTEKNRTFGDKGLGPAKTKKKNKLWSSPLGKPRAKNQQEPKTEPKTSHKSPNIPTHPPQTPTVVTPTRKRGGGGPVKPG